MNEIIETLRRLAGYRHLQSYLRERGLGSGTSWDDLRAAVGAAWDDEVQADLSLLVEDLRLHGRNHVFLYKASTAGLAALRDLELPAESPFSEFPLLTPDIEPQRRHHLTAVKETETHKLYVFCSHRIVRNEEVLDKAFLDQDAPEEVLNAEEIKYVSREPVEAVDVVAVPLDDDGLVEIRIDLMHKATDPTYKDVGTALRREMVSALGIATGTEAFGSPVDLAPAMAVIYSAGGGEDDDGGGANGGRIYEMAFQCGTDVRRREVMQRYDEDLRDEDYHVAGMEAIGEAIEIYRLGVHWQRDDHGDELHDAFLLLPGTLALLKIESPALYEVRVPRSVRHREYRFMMDKLAAHVLPDDQG